MAADRDNYWKNYNAQESAKKGQSPDTRGLSFDQSCEAQKKYDEARQQQYDRTMKTHKDFADAVKNAGNYWSDETYGSTSSGGSISLKGILVVIVVVAGCIWYFTNNSRSSVNFYSANNEINKLDEISDPPAAPGFVNIAERVLIYPNNKKESAIGEFRYGIPEDSIKWFLAVAKIEKAPVRMSLGDKKMVYLKNIPQHWITMTKGRKPVSQGWFMVSCFTTSFR